MNNTIEITMPGIEAKLDRIIALLETQPHCTDCAKNVAEAAVASTAAALRQAAQDGTEAAPVTEDTAKVETTTEPAYVDTATPETYTGVEEPIIEQPTVKREDVQRMVVTLSAAGKKDAVKAVVTAYAKNVSGIPEDKLAEVLDKLNALEG